MAKRSKIKYEDILSYSNLMKAHNLCKKGKGMRKEIILFNLKQEEYILWLYEKLLNLEYIHGGYTTFYISEPKVRKIEKSKYIDRIVHRFIVDNFLEPVFGKTFIYGSFACIKDKGMHKSVIYVVYDRLKVGQ